MTRAIDDLLDRVRRGGGVVRSADLVRRGVAPKLITVSVAAGLLLRLRRVWVAVPDADPFLIAAAQRGVVLACITRAERLGHWVLRRPDQPHVAAPPNSGRVRFDTAHVHRARPVVARPPGVLEDLTENTLDLVARCQDEETALAVLESALRRGTVTRQSLERLPISAALRGLLAIASPFSDSGLETFVPHRLRWTGLRILQQIWLAGHRVDFLIGERLVLQIDGGHHVGAQREEDIRYDTELMLLGYHVIRVGYAQVIDDWPGLQERIMRAIAQGLHLAG